MTLQILRHACIIILLVGVQIIIVAVATNDNVPSDWKAQLDSLNAVYAEDDTGYLEDNGYPGIYLVCIFCFRV